MLYSAHAPHFLQVEWSEGKVEAIVFLVKCDLSVISNILPRFCSLFLHPSKESSFKYPKCNNNKVRFLKANNCANYFAICFYFLRIPEHFSSPSQLASLITLTALYGKQFNYQNFLTKSFHYFLERYLSFHCREITTIQSTFSTENPSFFLKPTVVHAICNILNFT